jgi:hypothetical protein
MTERQWLEATDPVPMLRWLCRSGKAGERKLRLFAVACCRLVWQRLHDPRSRQAVEITERFIEGKATAADMAAASREAEAAQHDANQSTRWDAGAGASAALATALAPEWDPDRWPCAQSVASQAATAAAQFAELSGRNRKERKRDWLLGHAEAALAQAVLLRCIFGPLPFREVRLDSAWLTWNGGAVARLARAAYEERPLPEGLLDRARLAVLADALEETGCADSEILAHLRGSGPHVRGCFALDLILGRA